MYIVFPSKGKRGPFVLSKYLKNAIIKWNKNIVLSNKAILIHKEFLEFKDIQNILKEKYTYIWFERANYISLIKNITYRNIFKKIIYGPIVTPIKWFNIPKNNTYEKYWCLIMSRIYKYVVHSERVLRHIQKYTKCYIHTNKYIILKPCIETSLITVNIKKYKNRLIDFLIYIKYSDSNRMNDGKKLIDYLNRKYNVAIIKYGSYSKEKLFLLANNSKFCIYFSFYDTGALSLLEMKMMGVWPISHQKEFIENGYGSYVKELDKNINKSFSIIDNIYNSININPYKLSINILNNMNCVKSLYNILESII